MGFGDGRDDKDLQRAGDNYERNGTEFRRAGADKEPELPPWMRDLEDRIRDAVIAAKRAYSADIAKFGHSGMVPEALFPCRLAFLVSDSDWRDVLSLLPFAIWTRQYSSPPPVEEKNEVVSSPLLVFHEEEPEAGEPIPYDADSIIAFLRDYMKPLSHFVDQSVTQGFGEICVPGNTAVGQSFIPMQPVLSKVGLRIRQGAAQHNLVVSVRKAIDGPELATTVIPSSLIPSEYGWVTVEFETYPLVTSGTPYYLVVRGEAGDLSEETICCWRTADAAAYPGGELVGANDGLPGADALFKTYYPTSFLVVFGDVPASLMELLANQEVDTIGGTVSGVGLLQAQIRHMSVSEYVSLWEGTAEEVVVCGAHDQDYPSALQAAVLASFRHSPLLLLDESNVLEFADFLVGRDVIKIGAVDAAVTNILASANSVFPLSSAQAQHECLLATNTDNVILVGSVDLQEYIEESFKPSMGSYKLPSIHRLYGHARTAVLNG